MTERKVMLAHDCTRVALRRGIAHKILVTTSDKPEEAVCEKGKSR